MPKINVYLPDELATAVKDAQVAVSAVCQAALEKAVRDVNTARDTESAPSEVWPVTGLFSRFTPRARRAIALAEKSARDVPHNYVGSEHMLVGVIDEGSNLALKVLESLDIEADDLRSELTASMGPPTEAPPGHIPFTRNAKKALELTTRDSLAFGHNYIGCEHILLGLLAAEDGMASNVLRRMGVEYAATRRAVVTILSGFVHARQNTPEQQPQQPAPESASPEVLDQILRRLIDIENRLAG
jgi:ATP-dependent Clp protease ATP-binding subunit ClpC